MDRTPMPASDAWLMAVLGALSSGAVAEVAIASADAVIGAYRQKFLGHPSKTSHPTKAKTKKRSRTDVLADEAMVALEG